MSTFGGPGIPQEGLVVALDAAEIRSYPGTGATWTDMANGYVCTLAGGYSFSSDGLGSIQYNGTDSQGTLVTDLGTGMQELTVSVWYNPDATNRALTSAIGFLLHCRGAGFYLYGNSATTSGYLGYQLSPQVGVWQMITATWDGTTMKLYRNGVKQTNELAFSDAAGLRSMDSIRVGRYFNTSQDWTYGRLAMELIYNRALKANEISSMFNAQKHRFGL